LGSEKLFHVDRRLGAEQVEIGGEPIIRMPAPRVAKAAEEPSIRVELARRPELRHLRVGIAGEKCSGDVRTMADNSSCCSLGSSQEAGKPIAIVERVHAKPPVKCAAKPPLVSKTALHGDLLEA